MRVLVISNSEWNDDNSFGNTMSNFFEECADIEFANIYCRAGEPKTKLCHSFLQISDRMILNSLLWKQSPIRIFDSDSSFSENCVPGNSGVIKFAKKRRWSIFFLLRELLWLFFDYDCSDIFQWIDRFRPDILFVPTYSYNYINKLALSIAEKCHLPIVSYMSDDEYSLRKISLSPLFWIRRLWQRKWVIRVLKKSKLVYVISEIQKEDCKADLGIDCRILTKSYDFGTECPEFPNNKPLQLLYAGNLGGGRGKSLAIIAKALSQISEKEIPAKLDIYTPTPLSLKALHTLNIQGVCETHAPVPNETIQRLIETADIVIHVEGLTKRDALEVRQSFSTKLVDYFYKGKCILAVGRQDEASIDHLIRHEAAVVIANKEQAVEKIEWLLHNPEGRKEYGLKAFQCGAELHNRNVMQKKMIEDLHALAGYNG